mmetsp:Transcript_49256/g.96623  ORF Transcript_49256/g.96623 Transcript_49256/m.96623 type:complete len:106 (-) Transcript_49256:83-400(-)
MDLLSRAEQVPLLPDLRRPDEMRTPSITPRTRKKLERSGHRTFRNVGRGTQNAAVLDTNLQGVACSSRQVETVRNTNCAGFISEAQQKWEQVYASCTAGLDNTIH